MATRHPTITKTAVISLIVTNFFNADYRYFRSDCQRIGLANIPSEPFFYHRGQLWPYHASGEYTILTDSLKPKMDTLLVHYDQIQSYSKDIKAYLRKAFSIIKTYDDFTNLVPAELIVHADREQVEYALAANPFSIASTQCLDVWALTAKERIAFLEKNSDGYAQAKAYLFYRSLFAKR